MMQTFLTILAASAILQGLNAQCGRGCLRCDSTGNFCLFCDLPLGYISTQGGCTQINPANCILIDAIGKCLKCALNSYLDPITLSCVRLTTSQIVPNCVLYNSDATCTECSSQYVLKQGSCVKLNQIIIGCEIHSLDGQTCIRCSRGYFRTPSGDRCDKTSLPKSCLQGNYLSCNSCEPGHIFNPNMNMPDLLNYTAINVDNGTQTFVPSMSMINFWNIFIQNRTDQSYSDPCQTISTTNCSVYFNATHCYKCNIGFYLDSQSKQCFPMPEEQIPNCVQYFSATVCSKCANNFFLSNSFDCIPVSQIPNCIEYDGSASFTSCLACSKGMYVFQNICVNRTNTNIPNCQTYQNHTDACATCTTGFLLTSDSLACLPQIDNCLLYNSSSVSSTQMYCQQCKDTFVLNGTSCSPGSVANCLQYSSSSACSLCNYTYFLSNNNCNASKPMLFCHIYNPTKPDTCTSCQNNAFLFSVAQSCMPLNLTANCATWSDYSTCTSCTRGFVLLANVCQPIPAALNCAQQDPVSNSCLLCNSGYYLSAGACLPQLNFQTEFCKTIANDGIAQDFTCSACDNYYRIYNYANEPVCVSPAEISTTPITNCQRYEFNLSTSPNTFLCTKCLDGLYIASNQLSCLSACPAGQPIILETQTAFKSLGPSCDAVSSSTVASYYLIEGTVYISSCLPTAVTYHSHDTVPLTFTVTNTAVTKSFKYGVYSNQVICDTAPTATATPFFPGGAVRDINCGLWIKVGSNYYCNRCNFGQTGPAMIDTSVTPNQPYVTCAQQILGCDYDVFYGGLEKNALNSKKLLSIFSCHKCYRDDQIPVAFVTSSGTTVPFNIKNATPNTGVSLTSNVIQCLSPTATDLQISPSIFIATVPANCGLLVVFTDFAKSFLDVVAGSTSLRCVECKPGFSAVREGGVIKSCVRIANCSEMAENQIFSACSTCQPSWTWPVSTTVPYTIDTQACVRQYSPNCFLSINSICYICKPNYSLNLDGVCELISPPFCQTGSYSDPNHLIQARLADFADPVSIKQWILSNQIGCSSCSTPYLPVTFITSAARSFKACTFSPYVTENNFIPNTVYIYNCKNYAELTCAECEAGYILSSDNKACVSLSSYPFCTSVNLAQKLCVSCANGYVLVQGFCEKPIIPYCIAYNSNFNYQVCITCAAGYRLVSNTCIEGSVANCQLFDALGNCQSCVTGFVLLNVNNAQYCMPLSSSLNCTAADTALATSTKTISCTQCKSGFGTFAWSVSQPICLQVSPINGCAQYDTNTELISSTFSCLNCNSTFYLQNQWTCLPRTVKVKNCVAYSPQNDFCSQCEVGYYLTNDRQCRAYPSGIYRCTDYSSLNVCTACQADRYLSGNSCQLIDKSKIIQSCQIYNTSSTCQSCHKNYFLSNNTCVPAFAQNCKTFVDINQCATCSAGYGLAPSDSQHIINCIPYNNPYCSLHNETFPFNCLECQNFYYVKDGRCLSITSPVSNCVAYSSAKNCKRCSKGFVLNQDQLSCLPINNFGVSSSNCNDLQYTLNPSCLVCSFGHYYDDLAGTCVPCQSGKSKGCAICSLTNTTVCQVCMSGYYFEKGYCVPWNVTLDGINGDGTTDIDPNPSGVRIISFMTILTIFSIFLN